jgi:tRNA-binding protein
VGTIEEVQDVEKSDKVIRIRVDLGDHTHTVFSGMKKERNSRELVGRQALFVVNLG